MKLVDVYSEPEANDILWALLFHRPEVANISHRRMPTWQEHCAFVDSRPYQHWYLIDCGDYVGGVYLSKQREIGIGVLQKHWGHGYGKSAILMLMEKHPGEFLANVAPANRVSIELFADLGFRHIQNTYRL